jgi:hypothetical protein
MQHCKSTIPVTEAAYLGATRAVPPERRGRGAAVGAATVRERGGDALVSRAALLAAAVVAGRLVGTIRSRHGRRMLAGHRRQVRYRGVLRGRGAARGGRAERERAVDGAGGGGGRRGGGDDAGAAVVLLVRALLVEGLVGQRQEEGEGGRRRRHGALLLLLVVAADVVTVKHGVVAAGSAACINKRGAGVVVCIDVGGVAVARPWEGGWDFIGSDSLCSG